MTTLLNDIPGWQVPATLAQCGNPSCSANLPIQPNGELAGGQIMNSFVVTAYLAIVISAISLWHERHSLKPEPENEASEAKKNKFLDRIKLYDHAERISLMLSDQQSIAGISFLVAIGRHGCTISTYTYNVSCFLVMMSMITHLNAILNIRNYFVAGWRAGTFRSCAIVTLMAMAGNLLFARNTTRFPSVAGPDMSVLAVCFENTASYNSSTISDTEHNFLASQNITQFAIILLFTAIITVLFIVEGLKHVLPRWTWWSWTSYILRVMMLLGTCALAIWLSNSYFKFRNSVEGDASLFQYNDADGQWTNSNVLGWALFASTIYGLTKDEGEISRKRMNDYGRAMGDIDSTSGTDAGGTDTGGKDTGVITIRSMEV